MQAGFELELVTHFMAGIYPLARLIRRFRMPSRRCQDGGLDAISALRSEFTIVPVANALRTLVLRAEAAWVSLGNRLPFGTSPVAVARRPDGGAR